MRSITRVLLPPHAEQEGDVTRLTRRSGFITSRRVSVARSGFRGTSGGTGTSVRQPRAGTSGVYGVLGGNRSDGGVRSPTRQSYRQSVARNIREMPRWGLGESLRARKYKSGSGVFAVIATSRTCRYGNSAVRPQVLRRRPRGSSPFGWLDSSGIREHDPGQASVYGRPGYWYIDRPGHECHGSTTGTSSPSKCRVLRVAIVARRAWAMPAMSVSRRSTLRPVRWRSAAS